MVSDIITEFWRAVTDVMGKHGPAVDAAQTYAPSDYSIHFFLQIAVILLVCRVVGWLAKKFFGQPQVVGEMIAGVILGPSLFGLLFPNIQGALFPKESRNMFYVGAQFGVGLYVFLVGTTLRLDHSRSKAKNAVGVSAAGIAAPFLLAALITPFLIDIPGLFTARLVRPRQPCSWARASRLPPFRCLRGSSTNAAWRIRRSAPSP